MLKTQTALIAIALTLALVASCKTVETPEPDALPPVEAAPAVDTSVDGPQAQKAFAAMGEMQKSLAGKLKATMKEAGPGAAITVCKDEAPKASKAVGEQHGITLGRMSHKLRNPQNQPPEWAAKWMADNGDKPSTEVQPTTVELGDGKLGVIKPIGTMSLCTKCHGDEASIPPEVVEVLGANYPEDKAVGFSAGQVRGAFWAEVPPM